MPASSSLRGDQESAWRSALADRVVCGEQGEAALFQGDARSVLWAEICTHLRGQINGVLAPEGRRKVSSLRAKNSLRLWALGLWGSQ